MLRENLRELGDLHAELTRLLVAIEAQTAKLAPDMAELARVRLKLTQASRRRAALINVLIAELSPSATAPLKAQLTRVLEDQQNARIASAGHIGAWTNRSIAADWPGYRAASHGIRTEMRRQIDRERAVFSSIPR